MKQMDNLKNKSYLPIAASLTKDDEDSLFVKLSRLFSNITSWQMVVSGVLDLAVKHVQADCGWFALYDEKSGCFTTQCIHGIKNNIIYDISSVISTGSISGGTIIINDLDKYFYDEADGFPSALICYPFNTDGKFLGSIFLCKNHLGRFSETDKKELEALCFYCEKLVENAVLFKNLQHSRNAMNGLIDKIRMLEKIKGHLCKFVPTSVIRLIEESPENPRLSKSDRDVTVLFLDIEGYTTINQSLDPYNVNFIIESYFSSFLDDIYSNHGDINETAGDGLMILFMDADPQVSAIKAIDTACSIKRKVEIIKDGFSQHVVPINVNIGIHSGNALVGSVRFSGETGDRWTFTASGMTTNVASRITQFAKNGEILISGQTHELLENKYKTKKIGHKKLKNIEFPVMIYKIL